MSEERFTRIALRLDNLQQDVTVLKQDVAVLKQDIAVLKQDVTILRQDVTDLRQNTTSLRRDVDKLTAGQEDLRADQRDLRRHMLVLHEEVIATIKALDPAPQIARLERKFERGLADLREEIGRRLDPLEVTVRWLVQQQTKGTA